MKLKKVFAVCAALAMTVVPTSARDKKQPTGTEDRQVWVNTLVKIADPVLSNLANNTLRANMPQESLDQKRVHKYSHLEAVGRTLCGIAPWLELGADETEEGKLRSKYIQMTLKGLANAVNPASPDYLDFGTPSQPLVDAAFLAQGLLRAPKQIWSKLDKQTQERMVVELKRSRGIKPFNNNWLLFASMVEAALLEFTGECDMERLAYGVDTFRDKWYMGDGIYGDGPNYHADYYNSFVIHPMLTDILTIMQKHGLAGSDFLSTQLKRHSRYNGWLRIGFAGSQINMSEAYINTGSVYLCTFGFLALGLPHTDPFWSDPFTPWTGFKAWNGEDVKADHAIRN